MRKYEKIRQAADEVRKDELARQNATASRIQVPNIDVRSQAYKSAQDLIKTVGTDKIYSTLWSYSGHVKGSDYEYDIDDYNTIFLYAANKEDAESRLNVMKGDNYSYSYTEPKEVSYSEAMDKIQQNLNKPNRPFKELTDHILTLPTKAMYDEMKKSIDWAINLLKKLKDQDEAYRRQKWLETPEGKAWLAKYEADTAILDKLQKQQDDAIAKAKAKREQQEQNTTDVIDILEKKSQKYPQYKDGIAPVIVDGGRKFKGKGFAISFEDCSGSDNYVPMFLHGRIVHDYDYYHQDDEWTNAIIYDPISKKIHKANIKFCKVDTSVSNEQCVDAFRQYCEDKVKDTIAWCKSKDSRKSDFEINRWAKNIIKKYHPWIDVDKYITFDQKDLDNAETNRIASTVDWAISLRKGQAETERIIMRALSKKGIDYTKHEALISMKLQLNYGHAPKVMNFN